MHVRLPVYVARHDKLRRGKLDNIIGNQLVENTERYMLGSPVPGSTVYTYLSHSPVLHDVYTKGPLTLVSITLSIAGVQPWTTL